MAIPKLIDLEVRKRARERCQYCLTPQSSPKLRFWIDHIIASQHLGPTVPDNLSLSCPFCNRHKGSKIVGIDPVSKTQVSLFNLRVDSWIQHFKFQGNRILGLTATGCATLQVLALNHPGQLMIRNALLSEGILLS